MTPGHTPALPLLKSLKSTSGWQEEAGAAWECSQHGISGVLLTAALPEVLDLLLTPSTAVFTLLKEDAAFPPFPEARSWALWSRQMDVPHPPALVLEHYSSLAALQKPHRTDFFCPSLSLISSRQIHPLVLLSWLRFLVVKRIN